MLSADADWPPAETWGTEHTIGDCLRSPMAGTEPVVAWSTAAVASTARAAWPSMFSIFNGLMSTTLADGMGRW
jgi:hypothetical protein